MTTISFRKTLGENVTKIWFCLIKSRQVTPTAMASLPSTVKADAAGRLVVCTFSENSRRTYPPVSATVALLSVGAVVSALTSMLNSSLTEAVPSLAVTFTASVSTSAACAVPAKVRVEAVKPSHVGRGLPSAFVAV